MRMRFLHVMLSMFGIRVSGQRLLKVQGLPINRRIGDVVSAFMIRYRLYTVSVWSAMCVASIDALMSFIEEPSARTFSDAMLTLTAPIQYTCSVLYFANDHIDKFFTDTVQRSHNTASNGIGVIATLGMLAYVITTSFFVSDRSEWYIMFCTHISRLYGSFAISLNAASLTFVFWRHVTIIDVFVNIFAAQDWRSCADHQVSVLLRTVIRLKESLQVSTELLSPIFSLATAMGGLSLGVALQRWHEERFDEFTIASAVLFGASQVMFFYVIYRLSSSKSDIQKLVHSAAFADSFLQRRVLTNAHTRILENSTTIDWFVITQVLKDEWLHFTVLGLPLHSGAFLKQCFLVTSALVVLFQERNWIH